MREELTVTRISDSSKPEKATFRRSSLIEGTSEDYLWAKVNYKCVGVTRTKRKRRTIKRRTVSVAKIRKRRRSSMKVVEMEGLEHTQETMLRTVKQHCGENRAQIQLYEKNKYAADLASECKQQNPSWVTWSQDVFPLYFLCEG